MKSVYVYTRMKSVYVYTRMKCLEAKMLTRNAHPSTWKMGQQYIRMYVCVYISYRCVLCVFTHTHTHVDAKFKALGFLCAHLVFVCTFIVWRYAKQYVHGDGNRF